MAGLRFVAPISLVFFCFEIKKAGLRRVAAWVARWRLTFEMGDDSDKNGDEDNGENDDEE